MSADLAITGDSIINRRVSVHEDGGLDSLLAPVREADVGFTHLETVLVDPDEPDTYPAAEAGGTWMRSPPEIADELARLGFDAVSHASNHALDYGYGGLRSTWTALDAAGIAHAGTGRTLGDARSPAFVETAAGRVALVSMTSSFPRWSRAGAARDDVPGRPGVNPMRYHPAVDPGTLSAMRDLAETLGWWVTETADGAVFNPPGLHNTTTTVVEAEEPSTVPHAGDLEANARAVSDAAARADLAIAHLHTHEWDPAGDLSDPADFVTAVAHECVDAGADVVVAQGTHSPLRGIELYEGTPIFHDPGDLFRMSDTVARLPADFYERYADALSVHPADATPAEGLRARKGGGDIGSETGYTDVANPPGGYDTGSVAGNVVAVCSFADGRLSRIELHPGTWPDDPPAMGIGVPERATGEAAHRILADLRDLSESHGTTVDVEDGVGVIEPPR